ncbi:MAG: Sua5/YciO/YrdC/YwlC family protein, partial [Candidatus Poribacteria bacterium]
MTIETGIAKATRVIRAGGVVALPTDTVYGLAVDPTNAHAIRRLFDIKRRDGDDEKRGKPDSSFAGRDAEKLAHKDSLFGSGVPQMIVENCKCNFVAPAYPAKCASGNSY